MGFVNARCTNCGGTLKVDSEKDAAICEYCGSTFIIEKAINYYHTINNNHITGSVVNIYGSHDMGAEDYFEKALSYLRINERNDAAECMKEARRQKPDDGKIAFYSMIYAMGVIPEEYVEGYPNILEWEIQWINEDFENRSEIYFRKFFQQQKDKYTGAYSGWPNVVDAMRCKFILKNRQQTFFDYLTISMCVNITENIIFNSRLEFLFKHDWKKEFDPYRGVW